MSERWGRHLMRDRERKREREKEKEERERWGKEKKTIWESQCHRLKEKEPSSIWSWWENLCIITYTCTMLDFNHYIYIYQSNALPRSQPLTITFIHQSNILPRSQPSCITLNKKKKWVIWWMMSLYAHMFSVHCLLCVSAVVYTYR